MSPMLCTCLFAGNPKLLLEEALSIEKLATEGLAAGQVSVHLDPRPADGNKLTEGDAVFDLLIERWVVLLHPIKLLGLEKK